MGAAPGIKKRLKHRIEYIVVRSLVAVGTVTPLRFLRRVGGVFGWIAYRVVGVRRTIATQNIAASLPGSDHSLASKIALESYKNYGRSLMELSTFKRLSASDLSRMVVLEGRENLDGALARGKGAILFTGHFGNWELISPTMAVNGYPFHATDTAHSNRLTHRIILDLRTAHGTRPIEPRAPIAHLYRLLSENQVIAYVADQDAGRRGIFVEFFGRPASTNRGPAVFAVRKGCPIVPGFMIRQNTDHHILRFGEALWPDPGLKGAAAMVDLTQRYTRVLEAIVREYPEMYFWVHRRWKTKPAMAHA